MSGRPAAPDPRQDSEEKKVMKVLDMSGPPTATVIRQGDWWKWWVLAVLLLIPLFLWIQSGVYSVTHVSWDPHKEHLDFESNTAGCDLVIERYDNLAKSTARLSYWKSYGSGSLKIEKDILKLDAHMSEKAMTYRCILRMKLAKKGHFKDVTIDVHPDASAETVAPPSNVAEIVAVKLIGMKASGTVKLNIEAAADSYVQGVSAEHLDMTINGGKLTVTEHVDPDVKLAKNITVDAKDAVFTASIHSDDVNLVIDEESMKTASLAAGSIAGNHLSKGALPGGSAIDLSITAPACGTYVLVADAAHMKPKASLATKTGETVQAGPSLLPHGKDLMNKTAKWLKENMAEKFMIYFNIVAPNAPLGTTRLMSTAAYRAFSVELFSMISAGMLTPSIERIETPIIGFDFLWPHLKDKLTTEEEYDFSKGVFDALSKEINIYEIGIPQAKWTWDPPGPTVYVYDYVPDRHHANRGGWKQRLLSTADTGAFLLASYITIGLGVILAGVICYMLWFVLRPNLMRKLRELTLYNAASYRLIYEEAATDWNPAAAFVHWPRRGVLLRWAKRQNINGVASMTFEGRSWPGDKVHVAIEKVEPWRLPDYPMVVGQQCFLFGTNPATRPAPEIHIDKLDQTLWGTWCLCAGGKTLASGTPVCFRIVSLNGTGRVIEKSSWTRPVMIEEQRPFVQFPLLFWKAFFPILPQDTFQHFLDTHCLPISPEHAQVLELTQIKLFIVNDSDLFMGAFDTTYGNEQDESMVQKVRLVVSTGGDIQTSMDDLYVETLGTDLPINSSPLRAADKVLDYKKALGDVDEPSLTLGGKKFLKLDMVASSGHGTLKLPIGEDTEQIVRFDAQVETGIVNFTVNENTARYETTWGELTEFLHHKKNQTIDQLVLRDGMAPVAALSAKFDFSNFEFGKHKPALAEYDGGFPNKIFSKLSPGQVFQWGCVISLVWEWTEVSGWEKFDLILESEPLQGTNRHDVPEAKWVPNKMRSTTLATNLRGKEGKALLTMAPDQPYDVHAMFCRIMLRHPDNHNVIAKSPEFLIDRPVNMGDLELAYAAYCVRNQIPMNPIPKNVLTRHGICTLEREFFLVQGYRAPLTTPFELKSITGDKGMNLVVKNPGSLFITNGKNLNVYDVKPSQEEGKEGAKASDEAPEQPTVKSHMPVRGFMDIPTNVFWRRGISWNEEVLLWYSMAPSFAQNEGLASMFRQYEYEYCAKFANVFAFFVRIILRAFVYLMQIFCLCLPAILLFWLMIRGDALHAELSPSFQALAHVKRVYLTDFAMYPTPFDKTRWGLMNGEDHVALHLLWWYLLIVIVGSFYTNFLHFGVRQDIIYRILNKVLAVSWFVALFTLILFVSLVIVWVLLGAMINPNLIPIALAIIGVIIIGRTQWGNLKMAKEHVEAIVYTKLDLCLHAMMEVFVGPEDSDAWMSMADQATEGGQICEMLRDSEKEITKKLYEQSSIVISVDQLEVDRIEMLRNSASFKQCLPDAQPNKYLATDFVPKDTWKLAQNIANDNADLYKKRQFNPAPPYEAWDAPFTAHALSKALAMKAESLVPPPGQVSKAEQIELDEISRNLHLHKETTKVIFKAFLMSVHLAQTSEDKILKDVFSVAPMMSAVRVKQLFTHFVPPEDGSPSTAQKYMIETQQSEMEKYDALVASSLTQLLDWQAIGRSIASFAEATLYKVYATRAVDNELNECLDGSAAFKVVCKAYEIVYEKWDTYKVSPKGQWQLFVDLGLVSEEYISNPDCQGLMNNAVDLCRYFDGSIDPESLIKSVKHMILEREEGPNAPEFPDPMFLWYDALKRILEDLGWAEDEMEESWLKKAWHEITEGSGFFRYRDAVEINALISMLADDGLWKAAVKCLMKQTQLYGYASCDPLKLGKEEAAKQAHTLQYADMSDLKWVNNNCAWPEYIESDIWKKHARKSHLDEDKGPRFLPLFQTDDFLMDVVYGKEADPNDTSRKFTPLYAYPDNALDLMWLLGDDGLLWHDLPDGKRPLRGIWLELALTLFDTADTLPSDLDVFYDCIEWQRSKHNVEIPWLRHHLLRRWILDVYIPENTKTVSCDTFMVILQKLNITLPADVVKDQIFTPCPLVPGDDLGELRYITDLGAGMRLWMGYGLWMEGIGEMIQQLLPRGPVRNMAIKILPEEFARMDGQDTANGIVQPPQALVLLHKLAHPGLTAQDLAQVVKENLGMDCPERQIHHYFSLMDVDGDGVMGVGEFIPTMKLIMVDYFPRQLMEHLGLTTLQIVGLILSILIAVVFLLLCIWLVIKTFTSGTGVAAAIHSGFNACTVGAAHVQSNASGGFNDSVSSIRAYLHTVVFDAMVAVLGLSKPVVDKLAKAINTLK